MMTVILCLLVFLEMFSIASSSCASVCICIWKNGKQTVECRRKGLIAIPEGINSNTQVINLNHNNLNHLPQDAFSDANLLNLQKIFLKSCHIERVDSSAFSHLSNLVEIDLSENRLKEVPSHAFEPAFELRELNLRSNPLKRIRSNDFLYTPSLTRLDLSFCLITSVAFNAFEPIENLLHLKLQGNKLTLLHSDVIISLERLHNVEIHENPWTCDCRSRPFRKWVGLIPHTQSPTCETPLRLRGKFIDALSLDDFACPPQRHPTRQILEREIGGNSSLRCPVSGVPSPIVSWFINTDPILNGTLLTRSGARAYIIDVSYKDQGSILFVRGTSYNEPSETTDNEDEKSVKTDRLPLKIKCIARNPAGTVSISFTLSFYHPTIFGRFSDDTMKVVVLLLAVSIFCLIIATIFIALFRRRSRIPSSAMSDHFDGFSTIPYDTAYADGSLITNEEPPSVTLNKYDYGQEDIKSTPEMVLWAPERALAVLDSAAPEHVIHPCEKELPPACRALLAPRHNNIYSSQKRLSYLPDFAPTFLEPYHFEHVTPDGRPLSQCQTLPRTLRVKTFSTNEENLVTNTLPHNLWTSSCRRYSQPMSEEASQVDRNYRNECRKSVEEFGEEDEQ